MRRARIAVLAVAVAAAGGAFFVAQGLKNQPSTEPGTAQMPAPPVAATDDVLVAAHDIPLGKLVADGDFAWQPWPKDVIGAEMIKKSDNDKVMADLNGSIVRSSLLKGEVVRRERLVKGPNAGFLSAILPSGKRAVAINIDSNGGTTAGGFILPNDSVDVIRTVKADTGAGETMSETLLRNIKVLAIGQNVEEKNGQPVVVGSNATLELDPMQAETIILAQRTGQLSLVLRSMLDTASEAAVVEQPAQRTTTIVRYGVPTESTSR